MLSAVILFALVFTVGTGFFLTSNNDQQVAASAFVNRLNFENQVKLENLTLRAGCSATFTCVPTSCTETGGCNLWLMINNTGGISSTVTSIFITNLAGQIISDSASGTGFLVQSDISLLPLTLNSGVSTLTSNIGIEIPAPFCYASKLMLPCVDQPVFVHVLTSLGNIFSVSFPPLNEGTFEQTTSVAPTATQPFSTQVDTIVSNSQTIEGCYGCVSGSYAGGNILILSLAATPSPVQTTGNITVTADVYDYSSYPATSISVTVSASYTGTASVTPAGVGDIKSNNVLGNSSLPTSPCTESTGTTISPPPGPLAFQCVFTANAGEQNSGTVTFTGTATACIGTGAQTASPCSGTNPGTPASSSLSTSNPVQVGAIASFGVWQPNFSVYYYTGCASTTACTTTSPVCINYEFPCSAAVISGSEKYVAFYIEVTNEYAQPLTILDGTYIQAVSSSIDLDWFIGGTYTSGQLKGAQYNAASGSFTPYDCVYNGQNLAPSGNCETVPPGDTIYIMLAASAPATSAWTWGSSYGGCTNCGDNSEVLIDFAAQTGAIWTSVTQNIPFEGLYVT